MFYIPFKGHNITFAISILVTLTIFFLVLIDLIPPTSLVIPLIGKYLLFTIILVAVSIFVSVITLNLYTLLAQSSREKARIGAKSAHSHATPLFGRSRSH